MNELFDTRDSDVNVSHKEHAKRIGLFFLQFMGDDKEYAKRMPRVTRGLNMAHDRARACPMRGKR